MQSVALSQLVPIIITYFAISEHPWTDIQVLPLALMMLIIFIVWHHYAIGIFYLRWFPNIIDTIIPFVVSIGQFFLVSYLTIRTSLLDIDMGRWTVGFAIFLVVGSFAYFAAAWRIEADLFFWLSHCIHAQQRIAPHVADLISDSSYPFGVFPDAHVQATFCQIDR
ncbi:MAG: hypothetical protein IPP15_22940 [Saprospiraceae bacterium]|uniref:Uncharacterized protein n=1 Tax=Candidatus Opimibacter skivensis TaxID=2982028 RepID=A0A9D7T038_9BACT|nr:hypothetical protein [Candidatus Opimibacter skivensis]